MSGFTRYLRELEDQGDDITPSCQKEFCDGIEKFADNLTRINENKTLDIAAGMSFSVFVMENHMVVVDGPPQLNKILFLGKTGEPCPLPAPVTRVCAGMNHIVAWKPGTNALVSWGYNVNASTMGNIPLLLFSLLIVVASRTQSGHQAGGLWTVGQECDTEGFGSRTGQTDSRKCYRCGLWCFPYASAYG